MIKKGQVKTKWLNILIIGLFIIYTYLNFKGITNKELRGDEAASLLAVIPAMKAYLNPKWLVSIFLFGHAPLRGLVEIPFLYLFGLKEFWLYLPNVMASLGLFWINFLILNKFINQKSAFIGSLLLAVNGGIILQRMIMGVGLYLLFSSLMIYFFLTFLKNKQLRYFKLCLLSLFLVILSYEEGIIFIPIISFWLFKKNLLKEKEVLYSLLILFLSLFIYLFFWLLIPFLVYRFGFIPNLSDFGAFRIMKRAAGGFHLNLKYNFDLLRQYNSLPMTITLIFGLVLSLLEKKSFIFWSFLVLPLLYFSLIKDPTVHLFNYLNFIIIIAALGWNYFLNLFTNKLSVLVKIIFYSTSVVIVWSNITFLHKEWLAPRNFNAEQIKSAAYLVRKNTDICDKIYTDIEGYVARIYFGRRLVEDPKQAQAIFLEKDLDRTFNYSALFKKKYSSYTNFMPYLQCQE